MEIKVLGPGCAKCNKTEKGCRQDNSWHAGHGTIHSAHF